jgi:hypothetical protein
MSGEPSEHDHTIHGLHKWYHHCVSTVGWLVLHSDHDRMKRWKDSLEELKAALKLRLPPPEGTAMDSLPQPFLHDLQLMSSNVDKLLKMELPKLTGGAKKKKSKKMC